MKKKLEQFAKEWIDTDDLKTKGFVDAKVRVYLAYTGKPMQECIKHYNDYRKLKDSMKKQTTLYLAHPFSMRHEIRDWELGFEERTEVDLINPFYDVPERDDVKLIDEGKRDYGAYVKDNGLSIVTRDLLQVEYSDGIVAFIEKNKESMGTPMEFFYSSRILQKPTYVVTSTMAYHPWIKGLATEIFDHPDKFERYIKSHT